MCGILCSIWHNSENDDERLANYINCKRVIEQRGPDCFAERTEQLPYNWNASFAASVLWMQGPRLVQQPCVDSDGNILLWNGDVFSGCLAHQDISDTEILLETLQKCENITETFKSIRGPYSVIYYQAKRKLLYFARDPVGRHSLLLKIGLNCKDLFLSSSASSHLNDAIELPAIGIFVFDLETSTIGLHPWRSSDVWFNKMVDMVQNRFNIRLLIFDDLCGKKKGLQRCESETARIEHLDEILATEASKKPSGYVGNVMQILSERSEVRYRMRRVLELLNNSIKLRVEKKPKYCKNCVRLVLRGENTICDHSKLGILFSGGLDSTILAALADKFVPPDESIDLINIAFEKARQIDPAALRKNSQRCDPVSAINFDVPDRKTGLEALAELREICPRRTWNFVECNVTREELQKYRSTRIRDLVYPLVTVLDDSLGSALWFASRGVGILSSTENPYESPCRVLLLGMGADELFGGYTRHRTTIRRGGWTALSEELDAELARISERNLGRDNRVVSDHGRQSRLPYLDEDFVEYVSSLNAWDRCNPTEAMPAGLGDKLLLRLVAHDIGLRRTCRFPKRAFQFGSRIARSKDNAKDVSKWT